MLHDYSKYATYICTLESKFASIRKSQVNCFTTKQNTGIANGVVYFSKGIRLHFVEHINFKLAKITWYSYEVWSGSEKLYFYDPQEHPDDPTLASTHPHHKHIQPNIKHHRIPAPGMRFDLANLDFLIREIEDKLL
jgi:hypothetical protein